MGDISQSQDLSGVSSFGNLVLNGISLADNLFGGSGHRERKTARSLMDYQNAINQKNWQMQNEYNEALTAKNWDLYNSPLAQMQAQKAAGLNPLFSGGTNPANQAPQPGTLQNPDMSSAASIAGDIENRRLAAFQNAASSMLVHEQVKQMALNNKLLAKQVRNQGADLDAEYSYLNGPTSDFRDAHNRFFKGDSDVIAYTTDSHGDLISIDDASSYNGGNIVMYGVKDPGTGNYTIYNSPHWHYGVDAPDGVWNEQTARGEQIVFKYSGNLEDMKNKKTLREINDTSLELNKFITGLEKKTGERMREADIDKLVADAYHARQSGDTEKYNREFFQKYGINPSDNPLIRIPFHLIESLARGILSLFGFKSDKLKITDVE